MKEISTTYFHKCLPILHALAKRKYPEAIVWRDAVSVWFQEPYQVKCFICDKIDEEPISVQEIREHGVQHLKEHNLLPFI